jgi:anhydro-N-acetylmuramic acid kinase
MSGTSLDAVDAIVADFSAAQPTVLAFESAPFSESLKRELFALNTPGVDEISRAAQAANHLADHYAAVALCALERAGVDKRQVAAIGCHGQTIRHRPDLGYTTQLNNPARLAERTGINIVTDFRSRDIAAGGQGAPLVPAFHDGVFRHDREARVVVNIGGIANLTFLQPHTPAWGFDCGPGNCLMDLWAAEQRGLPFDENGTWAATGHNIEPMLRKMQADPYFALPPPKSTGRDLFHRQWLQRFAEDHNETDIQATLLELTAWAIAEHVLRFLPGAARLLLCGGGAYNSALRNAIARRLPHATIESTLACGVDPRHVEALAFAWFAKCAIERHALDLTRTTGARGPRIAGCITPA